MFLSYFLRRERKAEDAGANGDDDEARSREGGRRLGQRYHVRFPVRRRDALHADP